METGDIVFGILYF